MENNMKIYNIKSFNNFNYKSSYEYREKRGQYAIEKRNDELSKSTINNCSEGLVGIGLLLLAFDKVTTTSLNKLKLPEKIGYAAFMTGAITQFLLMFKRSGLAYKYMKEYDQIHKND